MPKLSSSKEFLKIARFSEVNDYLSTRKVTWKFIVEKAAWWGGFYKRLVMQSKKEYREKSHL